MSAAWYTHAMLSKRERSNDPALFHHDMPCAGDLVRKSYHGGASACGRMGTGVLLLSRLPTKRLDDDEVKGGSSAVRFTLLPCPPEMAQKQQGCS